MQDSEPSKGGTHESLVEDPGTQAASSQPPLSQPARQQPASS